MKRILSLIIVSICASLQMSAQDVFFIFRNDGQFNSFFSEDVECIQYSKFDLDGIEHDSYVVQEIVTEDSLYRIPLEVIDSVGFEATENKMYPEVVNLRGNIRQYVVSATDTTIILRSDCPAILLPSVGDKLCTDEMSDVFFVGFAGKVRKISNTSEGILIECDRIALTDIYESYCSVVDVEGGNEGYMVKRRKEETKFNKTFTLPTLGGSVSAEVSFDAVPELISLAAGWSVSTSLEMEINCRGCYLIKWNRAMMDMHCVSTIKATNSFGVSGSLSVGGDHGFLPKAPEFPIAPFVSLFVEPGWFLKGTGTIGAEISYEDTYRHQMHFNLETATLRMPSYNSTLKKVKREINGLTLYGSSTIDIGVYAKLGFGLTIFAENVNIHARGDFGLELETKQELLKSDFEKGLEGTWLYDKLNLDRASSVYAIRGASMNADLGTLHSSLGAKLSIGETLFNCGVVPKFTDLKYELSKESGNKLKVSSKLDRKVLVPLKLGYKLFDMDKKEVATVYDDKLYTIFNPAYDSLELELPNSMVPGQKYYLYPCIKVFNYDLLASPNEEVTLDFPVQITSVDVSKASYYPEHYTQNGEKYSFKYNTKTLVELDPDAQVEEWGYFYVDEKNNLAAIMVPSSSDHVYEDSRYAYYRNEPKSQVMFGGLVRYKNDPNYYLNQSPKLYDIEYPKDASISLTSCTFVGTEKDKTYNNKKYNYCTHIKLNFDATGAYWLSVRPLESGEGWKAWDLPSQKMNPVDGANVMNIYYYYDSMPSKGEFKIALRAYDDTHNTSYDSSKYITLSYSNDAFTGCTLQSGNGIKSRIPVTNSSTQSEEDNKPFEFSIIKLTQEKTSLR